MATLTTKNKSGELRSPRNRDSMSTSKRKHPAFAAGSPTQAHELDCWIRRRSSAASARRRKKSSGSMGFRIAGIRRHEILASAEIVQIASTQQAGTC